MHVLLVTDAFPPICGGSGWSTYELARGLRRAGHEITIVRPRPGQPPGETRSQYEDFTVREFGTYAPGLPFVRNTSRTNASSARSARISSQSSATSVSTSSTASTCCRRPERSAPRAACTCRWW